MKKFLLTVIIFILAVSCSFAQKKIKAASVSQSAIKTVESKFTEYKKIVWRKIDTLFEAEIRKGKYYSYVTVQPNGKWLETMTEINKNDIPAEVVTGLHDLYSSAKIKAAATIERPAEEKQYIIEFRFHGKRGVATLNSKGKQG